MTTHIITGMRMVAIITTIPPAITTITTRMNTHVDMTIITGTRTNIRMITVPARSAPAAVTHMRRIPPC